MFMRLMGAVCLVLGAGIAAVGLGFTLTYEQGGPFTMGIGAMLFTTGWLLVGRRQ